MHPILFHLGRYAVHTYSIALGIAFIAALSLGYRLTKSRIGQSDAVDPADYLDVGYWMIIWGVVGARVVFILTNLSEYRAHPAEMLRIWNGGISFDGALLGGLIALIAICRRRHIPILRMCDLVAAPVMLGYAIGRIGCFFNGCCYGRPTSLPWGVRFHDDGIITPPSHPTQIYSSVLSFLFLAALLRMFPRKAFEGQVLFAYIILGSIERFIMEIWRGGVTSTIVAWGLTDVQFLSIGLIAVSAVALAILKRRSETDAHPPMVGAAQS